MGCTPAPACRAALDQATASWPTRNRSSDGICASPKHTTQNPTSDHERGNAFDLTHDPVGGPDCNDWAEAVKASGDPRVKYVIWNHRIWNPSVSPAWRPYSGSNPHTHHMHVSIHASGRDDLRPWPWSTGTVPPPIPEDDMFSDQDRAGIEELRAQVNRLLMERPQAPEHYGAATIHGTHQRAWTDDLGGLHRAVWRDDGWDTEKLASGCVLGQWAVIIDGTAGHTKFGQFIEINALRPDGALCRVVWTPTGGWRPAETIGA